MKVCPRCGRTLPATSEYFPFRSRVTGKLYPWCHDCTADYSRAQYEANKDKRLEACREYRNTHKEQCADRRHAYYEAHREEQCAATRAYQAAHAEERRAYYRAWAERNRERLREQRREYQRRHLEDNLTAHIARIASTGIRRSIHARKDGRSWEALVGYTVTDLMRHLETRFLPGMSWDNYGFAGWHIDHINPIASFSFTSPDDPEFKECWALSNLQPLWAKKNLSKGAKPIPQPLFLIA